MEKKISPEAYKILKKMQQSEITESVVYKKIAKFAKGEENKKTLERLASEEENHAKIWEKYTGLKLKPSKWKIFKYSFLARVFGFTFAIKLMESGEENAQKEYDVLAKEIEESTIVKQQEEEHEKALIEILDEERLKYVGSMVLGLNDALVELTGSLAGFTFAMQNTKIIALSGLIIGVSATFSMAASEFLSARSEGRNDAFKSCLYTGIAYLVAVALLILPYLLLPTNSYILALICMLAIVILIITVFTYYTSVAQSKPFLSRFLEMSIISVTVAVISFGVGILAKILFGIDI
ncbi:MAG: VIT1/CCC1 transporter family protein [Bacilli bacterium]|nr:VIT1/CCC1 transporter family protein [Bacilli bacterium]